MSETGAGDEAGDGIGAIDDELDGTGAGSGEGV